MLDQIPRRVERLTVVEQPDPKRRKRADPAPPPAIGAAHLEEALEAHLGKGGREMVGEVADPRLLAGKLRQFALEEGAKALAGDVDILAVAVDEVHRHIE